jgi:plasmid stabilization system protein ParE
MSRVKLTEAAEADAEAIGAWYEEQRSGLKKAFRASLLEGLRSLRRFSAYPAVYNKFRVYRLHRFPYLLYFVQDEDEQITIEAILHVRQLPRV